MLDERLLGKRVRISNPDQPEILFWEGTLTASADFPTVVLTLDDGSKAVRPQSFTIEEIDESESQRCHDCGNHDKCQAQQRAEAEVARLRAMLGDQCE